MCGPDICNFKYRSMGKLFYIIGASGAGKDSLINYCRKNISHNSPVIFAHRYITRPASDGSENHISLSEDEFELRKNSGLFALHWHSHNLHYGIGVEINFWLQRGFNVVINGSRQYIETARAIFPDLQIICIEAHPEIIAARLHNRGRENDTELNERLKRNNILQFDNTGALTIYNNTSVEEAGEKMLNILLKGIVQPV